LTQKIAGQRNEATLEFAARRAGKPTPPIVASHYAAPEMRPRQVTTPGSGAKGTLAWIQAAAERRGTLRAQRVKRRMEAERKERAARPLAQSVSRPFKARFKGSCKVCKKRFWPDSIIAKSARGGYIHQDCSRSVT
jgi:hypothetical protein